MSKNYYSEKNGAISIRKHNIYANSVMIKNKSAYIYIRKKSLKRCKK